MEADDIILIGGIGLLGYAAYMFFSSQTNASGIVTDLGNVTPIVVPVSDGAGAFIPPDSTNTAPVDTGFLTGDPSTVNVADLTLPTPTLNIAGQGGHAGAQAVSNNGIAFIEQAESFRATPYQDGALKAIGYGHNIEPGEAFPASITPAQGLQILMNDLQPITAAINNSVTAVLTQNMFDALASLIYNIGIGAFQGSTLLRVLNTPDYNGAAQQFLVWANPTRRAAESKLFLS